MALMVDKETGESRPFTAFIDADQLARDVTKVNDAGRGHLLSVLGMAMALVKNYKPFEAPTNLSVWALLKKFDKTFGATGIDYGKVTGDRTEGRYRETP